MEIVPLTFREANQFVTENHRHHPAVRGCKFAIGLENEYGELVGVAICGRPVSRHLDNGRTLEINRLCTDGTRNACSMLYGACCRIGKAMGYKEVITYILETEDGASLRASNFELVHITKAESWSRPSRKRDTDAPACRKKLYSRYL